MRMKFVQYRENIWMKIFKRPKLMLVVATISRYLAHNKIT